MLDGLLREHQRPLYEAIWGTPPLKTRPIVCSRRYGKTMTVLVVIEEIMRRHPGSIVRLAFPELKQSQTVILPNWRKVLRTCPEDLRPIDSAMEGGWVWPKHCGPCKCGDPMCKTSSGPGMLFFSGTDGADQREKLRGSDANWVFLDEAGSQKELAYTVDDILGPQLDESNGRMVMITTPPKMMDHDFVQFWNQGRADGLLVTKTIFDNTFYPREKLLKIAAKQNRGKSDAEVEAIVAMGVKCQTPQCSSSWEREYLCRMVTDRTKRVCPDFDEAVHVGQVSQPAYCTPYVFLDLGFVTDYFAAVFAVHDFATDKLVVLDEWCERRKSSSEIVRALKAKEEALWPDAGVVGTKIRRYADDPRGEQQLKDFGSDHDYWVTQGRKSDGKRGAMNRLTVAFGAGRIQIHERCEHLIAQLRDGTWDEKSEDRADYQRSDALGHLDAADALGMGYRCVDWTRNGVPVGKTQASESTFVPKGSVAKPLSPIAKKAKWLFRGALRAH